MRIIKGRLQLMDMAAVGKSGRKDPRAVTGSNNPAQQPDIEQFALERARIAQAGPAMAYADAHAQQAPADFTARTIPTRIEYVAWNLLGLYNVPQLLVPKNLKRMSLIITCQLPVSNVAFVDGYAFTFGPPVINSAGAPVTGLVLGPHESAIFDSGTIPINDIFMYCPLPATAGLPVIAYEGIEVPEANVS